MWNKIFNMRIFIPMHFKGFLFFILIVCVVSLFFVKKIPKSSVITEEYPHCI